MFKVFIQNSFLVVSCPHILAQITLECIKDYYKEKKTSHCIIGDFYSLEDSELYKGGSLSQPTWLGI